MSSSTGSSLSIYSIPAAYALAIVPHGYYLTTMMYASGWKWTNVTPRSNFENLKSAVPAETLARCFRARGAHLNALEGFPLFASAVIIGNVAKLENSDLNTLAVGYLGLRVLYTALYIGVRNEALSYLRTGVWGASIALPIWALAKSANAFGV